MRDSMSFFDDVMMTIFIDGKEVSEIYDENNDRLIYSSQIMFFDINPNSSSFTLPKTEFEGSLIIDWGDGNTEIATETSRITHNFDLSKSTGKIRIFGLITKLIPTPFYYWNEVNGFKLPNGVTEIGWYTFKHYPLSSVVLPSSMKILDSSCFKDSSVTNVILNEGLEEIRRDCFSGCSNLKHIAIPSSVTTVEGFVFYNSGVIDYQLYWQTPPVNWSPTNFPNLEETYYTIPSGCTQNYVSKNFPRDKLIERGE